MYYQCILLVLALVAPSIAAFRFAVLTSPTLGNFRDLSGLINGLLNFRHDVFFLKPDDRRNIPEMTELSRLQYIKYVTSDDSPFDSKRRYEYIYSQQETELRQLDANIIDYECGEALDQLEAVTTEILSNKVDLIVVDADFRCYYHIARATGLPYVSVASRSEPRLMQTPLLTSEPCFTPSFFTRLSAFCAHLLSADSPAVNSSLWLWNRNGIVDCPGPGNSHLLQVGGLSHREESPLPQELDDQFNKAKYGVIVFALPGVQHSDRVHVFMQAFEQLDQTIVWPTNVTDGADVTRPVNVLTTSLISENDLLAHVNVKLIVTDGNNARQLDALFHGVPVISLPLTASQQYNADRLSVKGHGRSLSLDFSSDDLVTMIGDILNDATITERARTASALLKGSPDYRYIAVYWLDFIARYGADHLKPRTLNTVHMFMIDVVLALILISLMSAFIVTKFVQILVKQVVNREKIVVVNEGIEKQKPKVEIKLETKPKEQKPLEKKVETPEIDSEKTNPVLQHQGSKKNKKKKNK